MKILLFTQFFPPEIGAAPNRAFGHARCWVDEGHEVTVVTNFPNSPFGRVFDGYENAFIAQETMDGVGVVRTWTFPSGKAKGKVHRGLSFLTTLFMAAVAGLRVAVLKKPDILLASAPYLSGVPGLLVSMLCRVPLIYEMRDPWIQVIGQSGGIRKGGIVYRTLLCMEKVIARHSKRVVVIGNEMAKLVQDDLRLRQLPEVVANGVEQEKVLRSSYKIEGITLPGAEGKFVVGCIGNMGNQYDFDVVVDIAPDLEECFFLLGEGAQKKYLQEQVKSRGITNVHFYPAVPEREVSSWIRSCDVSLVSMKKEPIYRVYLPKKVLDSLVLKVPVLYGGSGEVENILRESGGGRLFRPGDRQGLKARIRESIQDRKRICEEGEAGSAFVRKHFTRGEMARRYLGIFEQVLGPTPPERTETPVKKNIV